MKETKTVSEQSEDDIKTARMNKFESIFIPRARAIRDFAFANGLNASARFVHYTSADAALQIIESKRLGMRNVTGMSDYRELHHGYDILRGYFMDPLQEKDFYSKVDAVAKGAAQQAVVLFNSWWGSIQRNTYITCVSEHHSSEDNHGRLSMWRAFGVNSPRVAIVVNLPKKTKADKIINLQFNPVAYINSTETKDLIPEVLKNIETEKNSCPALLWKK